MSRRRDRDAKEAIQQGIRQADDNAAMERMDIFNRASGVIRGLRKLEKPRKSKFTVGFPDHLHPSGLGYFAITTNIPLKDWHGEETGHKMKIDVMPNGDMTIYGDERAVPGTWHEGKINNRYVGGPEINIDTLTVKATDPEAQKKVVTFVSQYAKKCGLVR